MKVNVRDERGLYIACSIYNQSQQFLTTKNDGKPADTNPAAFLPLTLKTLKQRAKLITPQPSVTLRDTEA